METTDLLQKGVDEPFYAIMIDAALTHTQCFLVKFNKPRTLYTTNDVLDAMNGDLLSYPDTDALLTSDQIRPGITTWAYVDDEMELKSYVIPYLKQMIDFAKESLADYESEWRNFPLYFGATGASRQVIRPYRIRICDVVRTLLMEESFNPFKFEPDYAIVVSGEQQGAFEWATLNYLLGTLKKGDLSTGYIPEETIGLLRMSGASTEIVFAEPKDDVMDSHYKYQLGPKQRWDLYSHSYIFSGAQSAMDRLNAKLVNETGGNVSLVYNPCIPGGSHMNWSSRVEAYNSYELGSYIPIADPDNLWVLEAPIKNYMMYNNGTGGDRKECAKHAHYLLELNINKKWCDFAHDRDCAWAGAYQPPVMLEKGKFLATDWIYDTVNFLKLTPTASMDQIKDQTEVICDMDLEELEAYNNNLTTPYKQKEYHRFCFIACWFHTLLVDGYGFPNEYNLTVYGEQGDGGGSPAEWTMGGAMYHVNAMPWDIQLQATPGGFMVTGNEEAAAAATAANGMMVDGDDSTFMPLGGVFLFLVALVAIVIGVQKTTGWKRERKEGDSADQQDLNDLHGMNSTTYGTSGTY